MDAAPTLSLPDPVFANLRLILRGLMAALGAWGIQPMIGRVLYHRISVSLRRIERMMVRFRAGQLWRVAQRDCAARQRAQVTPAPCLPRRFGWLVQIGGHQAACVGTQLQAVLSTPEMVELLAASSQAGRILRPLCRALAVELPGMVRTAHIKPSVAKRRVCTPRAVSEPFRLPLPRGVLAAARREGFGKDR